MDKTEYLKIIVWLLGCSGGLLVCIGGFAGYVHTSQARNTDRRFSENREEHCKIFDELKTKQDRRKR